MSIIENILKMFKKETDPEKTKELVKIMLEYGEATGPPSVSFDEIGEKSSEKWYSTGLYSPPYGYTKPPKFCKIHGCELVLSTATVTMGYDPYTGVSRRTKLETLRCPYLFSKNPVVTCDLSGFSRILKTYDDPSIPSKCEEVNAITTEN